MVPADRGWREGKAINGGVVGVARCVPGVCEWSGVSCEHVRVVGSG